MLRRKSPQAPRTYGELAVSALAPHQDGGADIFSAHLAACQRRSAQRMLRDFEQSGVDEDLEQLKAGWAPSFRNRSGFAAPRQPRTSSSCTDVSAAMPSGLALLDDDIPTSDLAMKGEVALERLQRLDALRQMAGSPSNQTGRLTPDTTLFSRASKRPIKVPGKRPTPQKQMPVADPWDAWEQRWEHDFRQFDEFERTRTANKTTEAESLHARREAEWRQKVEAAKRQAEEAARKRREAKPRDSSQAGPDHTADSQRGRTSSSGQETPPRTRQPPPRGAQNTQDSQRPRGSAHSHGGARSAGDAGTDGPKSSASRPRPSPAPPPAPKSKSAPEVRFATFAEFDAAWSTFEEKIAKGNPLCYTDVPWPVSLPTISSVDKKDSPADCKRKLRAALVRWHPDKWGTIMDLVCDSDRASVMERVKEVTQRILEEKRIYGG